MQGLRGLSLYEVHNPYYAYLEMKLQFYREFSDLVGSSKFDNSQDVMGASYKATTLSGGCDVSPGVFAQM